MDRRLLLILGAMTACPGELSPQRVKPAGTAAHKTVVRPVVRPVVLAPGDTPPDLQLLLAPSELIQAGPEGHPSWGRLEAACLARTGRVCSRSELRFPEKAAVARQLGLSGPLSFRWILGFTTDFPQVSEMQPQLILQVVLSPAESRMPFTQQHLIVDPVSLAVIKQSSVPAGIVGRPVGSLHRRAAEPVGDLDAARWMALAADEDEAVEAFRIHVLELESIGTPIALVRRAAEAERDEARHCEMALVEAGRILGRSMRLGPRKVPAQPRTDRIQILRSVAQDGALNETLSMALLLAEAARLPSAQRAVLEGIAADEVRHAALAWDTLHWAWPSLTPAEREELIACCRDPLQLSSLFILNPEECETIESTVRRQVIEPLLQGLRAA